MSFSKHFNKTGYTQHFINSLNDTLQNMNHNPNTLTKEKNQIEGPKISLKIPFHNRAIYDRLKLMKKHFPEIISNVNIYIITTCFRVENIASTYRKIKIKDMEKQDLVYKFRCCAGMEHT